jgi:hypothetical protein
MSPNIIPGRSAFAQLRLGWQLIVGVPKRILAYYSAHLLSLSKEFASKSFRLFPVNKIIVKKINIARSNNAPSTDRNVLILILNETINSVNEMHIQKMLCTILALKTLKAS